MAVHHDQRQSRQNLPRFRFISIVLVCSACMVFTSFALGRMSLVQERSPLKILETFKLKAENVPPPTALTRNFVNAEYQTPDKRNRFEDILNSTEQQATEKRVLNLLKILDLEDLESGLNKGQYKKSLKNSATFPKLETVFKKVILTQRTLKIGVSGGSVSTATYVGKRNCYVEKLKNNLEEILHTEVEIFNGALGATGSLFHTYCMDNYLNLTDLDVLLWECSFNDYNYHYGCSPQEEFTRKVLQVPDGPQLVYVNFVMGIPSNSCRSNEDSCSKPLSEHYNVPSLNMKAVLCDIIEQGKARFLLSPVDNAHPNVRYHALVGNFLTRMFGNVLMGIIRQMTQPSHPLSTDDKNEPIVLPLPLINTTKLTGTQCWSTAIAETGNTNPLVPILNNGWHEGSTAEDQSRVDEKSFWESREPNTTIKFQIDIMPYERETAHIMLGSLTCKNCGKVTAWLDDDESTATTVKTEFMWGFCRVFLLRKGVKPGVHTITLRNWSKSSIRVAAITTGFDSVPKDIGQDVSDQSRSD